MNFGTNKNTTNPSAFTVIELSLTLALMLTFATITIFSVSGIKNWKLGRIAGEELRAVYLAQKSYLADHPVDNIANVSSAELIPYLTGGRTQIPAVVSLEGETLAITFTTIPPTVASGGGVYDPSGSNTDSLWDAGMR